LKTAAEKQTMRQESQGIGKRKEKPKIDVKSTVGMLETDEEKGYDPYYQSRASPPSPGSWPPLPPKPPAPPTQTPINFRFAQYDPFQTSTNFPPPSQLSPYPPSKVHQYGGQLILPAGMAPSAPYLQGHRGKVQNGTDILDPDYSRELPPPTKHADVPLYGPNNRTAAGGDITGERNLLNIDQLIASCVDKADLKELNQQKRLLRNRQAAYVTSSHCLSCIQIH
jgi:hypothetical protein